MKKILDNNYGINIKPERTIKEEIQLIASKCVLFNKLLVSLNVTDVEYEKFGMILLISGHSYLNLENGSLLREEALLQKAVRSKDSNDIHLETFELGLLDENSPTSEGIQVISLIPDILKEGFEAKGQNVYKDLSRKEFLQFMIQTSENNSLTENFILNGATRTGKSFLTSYMLRLLSDNGEAKNIAYINWNRFISAWQMSFSEKDGMIQGEMRDIYMSLFKIKTLILDDFGLGKMSDWARDSILLPLLTSRKASQLKTGIITPFNSKDITNLVLSNYKENNKHQCQKLLSLLKSFKTFTIKETY